MGRRGGEASKHSAEVGMPHKRERDAHRRSHSIQQKVGAAVRLSQEQPSDEDLLAEFIYKRGDARAAVQEKTGRNGTREVLPRTTTTLVVLKASAYHTHRGEVPETETEQLSNKRLHPKDGRITARLFSVLFNSVFSPQRQPNQMLTDTQREWFCFL